MPGIVGIVARGQSDECQRLVKTMLATMMHEPSYVSGTQFDPDLGVYAGWVAHAGVSALHHFSAAATRGPILLSSGEFLAISKENLTRLYDSSGESFVADLDGCFSGVLIDPRQKHVLLFNDRFGGERIYYHETADATYFASEAKALLAVLPQLRHFDEAGVAQFLRFGATLPGRTLFRGISIMQPGSVWTFSDFQRSTKRQYFDPNEWLALPELASERFAEELAEAVKSGVSSSAGNDEALGISITAGMDTRMVMACLPQVRRAPICYTFTGMDGETLDSRRGREVAQACGLEHRIVRIGQDFLSNFAEFVDRTVYITDGCAGALGAHEIYLNSQAREIAPVRLTGNFGGEILRGMSTFKPLDISSSLLTTPWRAAVESVVVPTPMSERHPAAFAAFFEIPSIHFGIPAAARSQLTVRTPFVSNSVVRLAIRSRSSKRGSLAACAAVVERYRPALCDIPTDRGVLPRSTGSFRPWSRLFSEVTFKLDYLHKEGLPPALTRFESALAGLSRVGLLGLHKFLPYRNWFRRNLVDYLGDVLGATSTRQMPWWDSSELGRILPDHETGRRNYLKEINVVLTLEAVSRRLLGARAGYQS